MPPSLTFESLTSNERLASAARRRAMPPSAARLSSFSRAAQELCVTQSAVSHQIQQLENWAGQQLFRRVGRGGGCRLMRGNCSAKP
ncbi:LysR family transcriptional regulator [Paraburkholderia domus]|uniref:LysR family transcriptional regulator n=1 Tax=Paraburkholderia domus TaxID=2793075 RepID=UPI002E27B6A8|nr:LysR family transcriptional regulator [Paraburkholderia domus]